jgi:CRISPR-associated endonuclease/helicase Cas3
LRSLHDSAGLQTLIDRVADFDDPPTLGELSRLLCQVAEGLTAGQRSLREGLENFAHNGFVRETYPDRRGIVITARTRTRAATSWFLPPLDEGDDHASRVGRERPVSLAAHTDHVSEALRRALETVRTSVSREAFGLAAERHDWGKADDRFQALLRGSGRTEAWLFAGRSPTLLAKSDGVPRTPRERDEAHQRSGLPAGFRHEMLSVQLAERAEIPERDAERELILHLIAAHHGYGRPFAPVVLDDDPPDVEYGGVVLRPADRRERPPHRLDSGVADRFWSLTRRYGWWGLAYLESLLRLADQRASADEDSGFYDCENTPEPCEGGA